jgi:hypothetical protein
MSRRAALAAVAVVAGLSTLVNIAGSAEAASEDVWYLDMFATQSFAGNDGSHRFAGPWKELGESDGPAAGGRVWVWPHEVCPEGTCLKIGGYQVRIDGAGARRSLDLKEAAEAELSFDLRRLLMGVESSARIEVRVSGNGGKTWRTLSSYRFDRNDTGSAHEKFDISGLAGAETVVEFVGVGGKVESYVLIDNVQVVAALRRDTTTTEHHSTTTDGPKRSTTTTTEDPRPPTTTAAPTTTMPQVTAPPAATTSTTEAPATSPVTPRPPATGGGSGEALDDVRFWTKDGMGVAQLQSALPADAEPASSATPIDQFLSTVEIAGSTMVDHLLEAFLLGLFVAWLAVRGLARRATRPDPPPT